MYEHKSKKSEKERNLLFQTLKDVLKYRHGDRKKKKIYKQFPMRKLKTIQVASIIIKILVLCVFFSRNFFLLFSVSLSEFK